MSIDIEIRDKIQRAACDAISSSLLVVKHMTFSGYGIPEDEMWNEIISPMLRFGIELKVWGEIGQREDAYLCAAQTALGESTKSL
jgi:hypothetical protein